MSILLIDKGNTRLKWQVRRQTVIEQSGVVDKNTTIPEAFGELRKEAVSSIYIASVAGQAFEKQCCAWALEQALPEPQFVNSVERQCGVVNGYANPNQLGVDRWLVMIAVHNKFSDNLCVVDIGTAMTMDFILKNGNHIGGFIVPGPQLQINTLLENTKKIALTGEINYATLGKSTREAVEVGVVNMLGAFIKQTINDVEKKYASPFKLILTGGAANQVTHVLDTEYDLDDGLVFDGLAIVAAESK